MRPCKPSVTIITFNESKNIHRAINSVFSIADEIVIVDSGSTDDTLDIARSFGEKVKIFEHKFEGYGQQKNYAADLCKNDWILNIDADEEVSEDLCNSIKELIDSSSTNYSMDVAGMYRFARLNFFCGRPLYHGGWYPDYNIRFYNRRVANWAMPFVHEELRYKDDLEMLNKLNAPLSLKTMVGTLNGDLYHYTFQDVESNVRTNIRYARLGSKKILLKLSKSKSLDSLEKPNTDYLLLKYRLLLEIFFHPIIKFFECYFIKHGFLDGVHGFIIAVNAAHSIFMKYYFAYMDLISLANNKELNN
ncbi:MAG: glycosyltransferase family 2 protein [Oligoflexia bacterium]|nr:glycosyltransferase family 2 protein [Oligoflexia bacterium]